MSRKPFWACFGGFGLDGMDVQIYSFVIPALISLWKLTPADAGLLATCTLLLSAFGGWITGILADRYGRVLMLEVTIAWFAGFTFLHGNCGTRFPKPAERIYARSANRFATRTLRLAVWRLGVAF